MFWGQAWIAESKANNSSSHSAERILLRPALRDYEGQAEHSVKPKAESSKKDKSLGH
jgi:hypothetical protein